MGNYGRTLVIKESLKLNTLSAEHMDRWHTLILSLDIVRR